MFTFKSFKIKSFNANNPDHERLLERLETQAICDSERFFNEFPGEHLGGDWGVDAWKFCSSEFCFENEQQANEAWEIYSDILKSEIERIVDSENNQ